MVSIAPGEGITMLFILLGIGTIIVSSWVINDYKNGTRVKSIENLVACASGALACGIIQTIASLIYFRGKLLKRVWIMIHLVLFAALIVCFSIPIHDQIYGYRVIDAFLGVVGVNFILMALTLLYLHFNA